MPYPPLVLLFHGFAFGLQYKQFCFLQIFRSHMLPFSNLFWMKKLTRNISLFYIKYITDLLYSFFMPKFIQWWFWIVRFVDFSVILIIVHNKTQLSQIIFISLAMTCWTFWHILKMDIHACMCVCVCSMYVWMFGYKNSSTILWARINRFE